MAEDVVDTLLPQIQKDFERRVSNDRNIQRFLKIVREGNATKQQLRDSAGNYASEIGKHLAISFQKYMKPDNMPDGKFYWNIVERIIDPMVREAFGNVINVSIQCQKIIDKANGISFKTVKPEYPAERIKNICDAICDETADYETVMRRMESPVANVVRSFNDDFIEDNANLRDEHGFLSYIERIAEPGCCKWCTQMAGKWRYGEEPDDVYMRHDNCECTVTFYTEKRGYSQNVHSRVKQTFEPRTQLTRLTEADAVAIDEMIQSKKRKA